MSSLDLPIIHSNPHISLVRYKLTFSIYLAKELVKHLPALNSANPVIVTSVHPGAVATEQQQGATEAYGLLGKALEVGSQLVFMTPEQGAESALWAATAPAVVERREEVHGGYFSEADGKVCSSVVLQRWKLMSRLVLRLNRLRMSLSPRSCGI